ncbi:MAG: hypothetical protein Q8807_03680, partial ['Waltheria sp.' little leaf phytoplasma]|nr:hypothetical protein ['Waltheria sp.' little leaf phytoplasma]
AGTPGIDNKTIDGINLERLKRYHREYVNNGYHPKHEWQRRGEKGLGFPFSISCSSFFFEIDRPSFFFLAIFTCRPHTSVP